MMIASIIAIFVLGVLAGVGGIRWYDDHRRATADRRAVDHFARARRHAPAGTWHHGEWV